MSRPSFRPPRSQRRWQRSPTWVRCISQPVFPEVFLRERPGFDCVLGNPPWDQVVVQQQVWWGLHLPGIRGKPPEEMNASIDRLRQSRPDLQAAYELAIDKAARTRAVLRLAFPKMGSGYTDLYKAFAWRNWQLARQGGAAGTVLPRSALQAKGCEQWRKAVLKEGTFGSAVTLLNTGGWVFDDVHGQYVVALLALRRTDDPDRCVAYGGPFRDRASLEEYCKGEPVSVAASEFSSWSDDASFPQLPADDRALGVFRKLRMSPRLDDHSVGRSVGRTDGRTDGPLPRLQSRRWLAIPVAELHSAYDKHLFAVGTGKPARSENWTPPTTNTSSHPTRDAQQ